MRNAVAHLDDDLGYDKPVRRPKTSRKPQTAGKKRNAVRLGKHRARYTRYAAVGFSAAVAIGIVINALALQHERHPAPLFGKAIQLGATPVAPSVIATAPLPVPTQKPVEPPLPHVGATPASSPSSVPPSARVLTTSSQHLPLHLLETVAPKASAKSDDPIGALLRKSEKTSENPKTVIAVQQALVRLGFVLKADGTFGTTTRAALEAFERDQGLPVRGDLNHQVLKQLSAQSGVAIN